MLSKKWLNIIEKLDFAFQPIVNIQNGEIYAVEALLRNVKEAGGFYSIFNLFDDAYNDGVLYQLDLELRLKSFEKFSKIPIENLKLFYNLDNRILYMPDFKVGNTEQILKKFNLSKEQICFELSERGTLKDPSSVTNMVKRYKQSNFEIAIDDFGTGIAGFQMLYFSEANYIKIDRFFIQNIQSDNKKRLFCSHIIDIAHIMGITVIAEGVETKEEYYTCKELGADLIQGYFIQKPDKSISNILVSYKEIDELHKKDLRDNNSNELNSKHIEKIPPLLFKKLSFKNVFKYFKKNKQQSFIPIVDEFYRLEGVIYEKDVRELSYSPYGMALASNDKENRKLKGYIKEIVSVEFSWNVDKILEIYNINRDVIDGVFITQNKKYFGFVNLNNLLHISYKRNIEVATEKNPLTKLDGNRSIDKFFKKAFENNTDLVYHIVYFDFNSFKPFNDVYGFRKGDRAILLFSDILKKHLNESSFIAHIGGDDFFVGYKNNDYASIFSQIKLIQDKFKNQVSSLYNKEDRENGFIETKDRFGITRKFELLRVSAAIVEVHPTDSKKDFDLLIGNLKKESKKYTQPVGCCVAKLN